MLPHSFQEIEGAYTGREEIIPSFPLPHSHLIRDLQYMTWGSKDLSALNIWFEMHISEHLPYFQKVFKSIPLGIIHIHFAKL